MKDNKYFLNAALAVVLGIALVVCLIIRACVPFAILPKLDIPNIVLVSLIALVLCHYLAPASKCDLVSLLLAALTFGLLPLAAGFAAAGEVLKLALVGGIVFALTAWLYISVQDRLSSGPAAKLAPVFSAVGLYLAAQCFAGMIL